ncbi:MAG: VWA domain-containing protein [Calditrichaeota bacterium]|nr:MAG: VWA domain-containing protein [Calditrichota bacterium]MBL1207719.1 VWA domain-containing protein [Calditrichota bacterium]NOG47554.1 VWA domain-containing protein [Calditrichota bacterium]
MLQRIFLSIILSTSLLFAQGRIIFPEPLPPKMPAVPIELTKVITSINISQDVAQVKLEQSFQNKSSRRLQGEYIYSLPGIAQIDDFYLYINGKKTKGQLLDSKKARSIYEDIVRRMNDPALLEYADYGLFKASIFPINPNETRQIELSYSQVVPFESGHYKFELPIRQSGQGAIENYEINLELKAGQSLANIYSPSHKIEIDRKDSRNVSIRFSGKHVDGSRNFVLFYSLSSNEINGSLLSFRPRTDRDGYFMFFANPAFGNVNKKAIAKDVIFVIDVSGSMGGEKIEQARDALRFCVNVLNSDDRFEIIRFSSGVYSFSGKLQKAGKEQKKNALYFIDNLNSNGGTNINEALLQALKLKKKKDNRPTSIVFLTDGLPTEGITDIKQIVQNIQQESGNFIRLFNFGVGYDVNTWLLDRLVQESNGSVTYVKPGEDIESAISGLFTKISSPLLTDTKIEIDGVDIYDVYPQKLPDIFKGQRIMVTGRYRKSGKAEITLSGKENSRRRSFDYDMKFAKRETENDFIAKLWANRKVNHLLNKIRFEGENEELVQSVKNLGEEFGIVTPYTSYLVTEQKAELADLELRAPRSQMTTKLQKRKESMSSRGMGGVMYDALGSMSKDANKASGYSAVMSSSSRQAVMEEAEQDDDMLFIHKNVSGKAFTLKDGFWTENGVDTTSIKIKTIQFMGKKYLDLMNQDKELRKILSLGNQVIFNWKKDIYKTVK